MKLLLFVVISITAVLSQNPAGAGLVSLDFIESKLIEYLVKEEYFKPTKETLLQKSSIIVKTDEFKNCLTLFQRERKLQPTGTVTFEMAEFVLAREKQKFAFSELSKRNYLDDVENLTPREIRLGIIQFQRDNNLKQTGILTDDTFNKLMSPVLTSP